jgi:hypothetical protein
LCSRHAGPTASRPHPDPAPTALHIGRLAGERTQLRRNGPREHDGRVVTATSLAIAEAGPRATDSASDGAVVRELRELNRKVERLNRSVGRRGPSDVGAVGLLQDICEMTRSGIVSRVPEFVVAC